MSFVGLFGGTLTLIVTKAITRTQSHDEVPRGGGFLSSVLRLVVYLTLFIANAILSTVNVAAFHFK